jgi:ubiquinone/menaquinone biosynthesis C-methylase UbiE
VSSYLMDSERETQRLLEQARALPVRNHLRSTGLAEGMAALDAGCGPGLITAMMADMVGAGGSVVGLDMSDQRLAQARSLCSSLPQCRFVQADVGQTGLAEGSFDYVWSQFVFEYLKAPEQALAELIRVTRPGGRVVVADVDGPGDLNWPCPEDLQEGIRKLAAAAASASGLDVYVGRKLFHLFRRAGLIQVRVHLVPLYVVAGTADVRQMEDWTTRFQALEPLAIPAFGSLAAYREFARRYLAMLGDPDTLKYAVLLITEGQKQ